MGKKYAQEADLRIWVKHIFKNPTNNMGEQLFSGIWSKNMGKAAHWTEPVAEVQLEPADPESRLEALKKLQDLKGYPHEISS